MVSYRSGDLNQRDLRSPHAPSPVRSPLFHCAAIRMTGPITSLLALQSVAGLALVFFQVFRHSRKKIVVAHHSHSGRF
jgi:hypothetical protein